MHSEAKQTKTSESGEEKGLLQGHSSRQVAQAQKIPKLPKGFWQSIFKGQMREGSRRVCDQLMHNSLIG